MESHFVVWGSLLPCGFCCLGTSPFSSSSGVSRPLPDSSGAGVDAGADGGLQADSLRPTTGCPAPWSETVVRRDTSVLATQHQHRLMAKPFCSSFLLSNALYFSLWVMVLYLPWGTALELLYVSLSQLLTHSHTSYFLSSNSVQESNPEATQ